MHNLPPLVTLDYVGPALGALAFVVIMSLVREPTRRTLNAIFVAGAGSVYLSGGFGLWELLYPALSLPIVYRGLRSYRFIALGWIMHASWDIVHFVWGNPIWPFMPTSSFGCMIFDAILAAWLFRGAPSLVSFSAPTVEAPSATRTA